MDEIVEQKLKEREEKQIAQRLQKEWEELSAEKKLPATTTPEGKTIHDNIVKFGIAAGKQTFKDAYAVWEKVPKEYGGGYDAENPPISPSDAGKTLAAQKKVASKVGGQNTGTKPAATEKISYDTLHKARTTEELLKKAGYL